MLFYSILVILVSAVLGLSAPCIPSGDEVPINQALSRGGKGAVVSLCPGSVHNLNSTIYFTASRQTLTTQGDPTGRERALLIVRGPEQATAVQADCRACGQATVKSLEIDGNRPQLLRVKKGGALVELGNADDQLIQDCRLYEPRGWSALHFREGDEKQCRRGTILNNEIGPCGEEWDDEYDGLLEGGETWGFPRSDGISLACKDSYVKDNIIYDTTDGAIVLFGSSGSTVTRNQIFARTRVVLGGINLVDYEPWAGDYTGVKVTHNILSAHGRYFKTGIVIGPASWSDDTDNTVHGATVTDNEFRGAFFGYGLAVSSAKGFTVLRNKISADAEFSGVTGRRCPKAPENGRPTAFLINRGSTEGTFQDDFVNGEIQHLICLDPAPVKGKPYTPWRFRDAPGAAAAKMAVDPKSQALLSARIADALVKYQSTLMSNLQILSDRLDSVNPSTQLIASPSTSETLAGDQVALLVKRMEALEKGEKQIRAQVEGVQDDWGVMLDDWKRSSNDQKPILEYIYRSITSLDHTADSQHSPRAGLTSSLQRSLSGSITTLTGIGAFAILFFSISVLVRRWRKTAEYKGVKRY